MFLDMEGTPIIQWGIIGAGNISRVAIAPAFREVPYAKIIAVASSSEARARSFAADFSVEKFYTDYDRLLQDPDVDAIYIALPNNMHMEWTIRALEAGKHTLCEKPLAMNAEEAMQIQEAARKTGRLAMEAFMYRFHPRIQAAYDIIQSGAIGSPKLLHSSFCFTLARPDNYRNIPASGGGALYDVGCYCVGVSRYLLGEEPETVMAQAVYSESGIDESVSGILTFESGALAHIACSFGSAESQTVEIIGSLGTLTMRVPFTSWREDETSIFLKIGNDEDEKIFAQANPYALMLRHFTDCIISGSEPYVSLQESVLQAKTLDALFISMKSRQEESIL